ncbi:MAG: restriction endonuclease subunit S [Ignavibacteriaceae bacterium]
MKYKLKDLCSITKGATGLMKAIPGKYPLIALSDKRRSHNIFQFDANAVIVPLISSTGHGHASMKRVHYQEGKFALGNILCAVIPNDEKQLNAKYLHIYLQQFKDSLFVPLMKGAANVSLSMNKIAEVEIEIPSISKQLEIIALENKSKDLKDKLEEKLIFQDNDVIKLRNAFLREAMQGKLVPQDPNEEPASELLKKIKAENEKLIAEGKFKKQPVRRGGKPLPEIKLEEIPYEIPKSWVWCRLGNICEINPRNDVDDNINSGFIPMNLISEKWGHTPLFEEKKWREIKSGFTHFANNDVVIAKITPCFENSKAGIISNLPNNVGAGTTELYVVRPNRFILNNFIYSFIKTEKFLSGGESIMRGVAGQKRVPKEYVTNILFPLPPIVEQQRIVSKLEQLMQLCDELEKNIIQSKEQTNLLLQTVLREALEEKIGDNTNERETLKELAKKHDSALQKLS